MNISKKRKLQTKINLEDIIALMPGHVYWKDKNGILQGCNDEQAKDIGLKSRDEIIGLTAYNTLPKELADEVTRNDKEVMRAGVSQLAEEVLTLPSGKKSIWLSKKVPLYDARKRVCGILGISIDITEKKRIDEELTEAKHKLSGMTLVSASIAHELRTPLAAIHAAVEGIKGYFPKLIEAYKLALNEKLAVPNIRTSQLNILASILDGIIDEINYSNTIINMSLLNTEQLDLQQSEFHICSIVHCIEEALRRYPFQPKERELIHLDIKNNFNFLGEEILTVHVLFNLLKNALYYIKQANKGDIHIRLASTENYNKLYFCDTGKGIAADILPNIFDLFFSKTRHGRGVGLAFCKMVMQNYGGNIECKSIEEEFTEFILSFPKQL